MENLDYLLAEDFSLTRALDGEEREKCLRDAADLVAGKIGEWQALGREGFAPDDFKRWKKMLEGLQAAAELIRKLRRGKI